MLVVRVKVPTLFSDAAVWELCRSVTAHCELWEDRSLVFSLTSTGGVCLVFTDYFPAFG